MNLEALGWDDFFATHFEPRTLAGLRPGRVFLQHNKFYQLYTDEGELTAEIAGRVKHRAAGLVELPAVGDWVAVSLPRDEAGGEPKAVIREVLPRKSAFTRRAAGRDIVEQVVAANIDTLFIVMGLDNDYNPRRLERYLVMAGESGARPVVVLNKADVSEEAQSRVEEVRRVAAGADVLLTSAKRGEGLEELLRYTGAGQTVSLVGSSGVGKSTIINRLLGREKQRTSDVREGDDRGKHTTTHRELLLLPSGGCVIDTPGMRELQLLVRDRGLQEAFDDVEGFAAQCRFNDCRHEQEPGCAVREALTSGELDAERFASYRKMRGEMDESAARVAPEVRARIEKAEKERVKKVHQAVRVKNKQKR